MKKDHDEKKCGNPDLELHPVGGAASSSHI